MLLSSFNSISKLCISPTQTSSNRHHKHKYDDYLNHLAVVIYIDAFGIGSCNVLEMEAEKHGQLTSQAQVSFCRERFSGYIAKFSNAGLHRGGLLDLPTT